MCHNGNIILTSSLNIQSGNNPHRRHHVSHVGYRSSFNRSLVGGLLLAVRIYAADAADTNSVELYCRLQPRLERFYVGLCSTDAGGYLPTTHHRGRGSSYWWKGASPSSTTVVISSQPFLRATLPRAGALSFSAVQLPTWRRQ